VVSGKHAKRRRARHTSATAPAAPGSVPGVLAPAWEYERVTGRHMNYASSLVADGVTFEATTAEEKPSVLALVTEHIAGAGHVIGEEQGGLVAKSEGLIVGALVVGAAKFTEDIVCFIRYLVVEPTWRGRGVAVVLLGVLPQLIGEDVSLTIGNCAVDAADFYQRAGFTVLEPGVPLPFPFGARAMVQLSNRHYPCWFFR